MIRYLDTQYTLSFNYLKKKKTHNTYPESACQPQASGSADCWYCPVLISNSLWNVIQKPEAEKCWKSSFSVSWQCPKGWTYWLRPILLTHLFRAIWKAFKSELSCNDVLTNNTKALVYGANSRGEPGPCPRLRHNGCYSWTEHLWVIIWHNGWWQVIREDFNFRGDDGQRTSSLPPFTPIPSLLCYLSHVTCYPKNAESGR